MQAVLTWPGTDLDMILFPSSTNQIVLVGYDFNNYSVEQMEQSNNKK